MNPLAFKSNNASFSAIKLILGLLIIFSFTFSTSNLHSYIFIDSTDKIEVNTSEKSSDNGEEENEQKDEKNEKDLFSTIEIKDLDGDILQPLEHFYRASKYQVHLVLFTPPPEHS